MSNPHKGSNFDDFLSEHEILEECTAAAVKSVLASRIENEMRQQNLNKSSLSERMLTSQASLDNLLDAKNDSLTLSTLVKVANALGKQVVIDFV